METSFGVLGGLWGGARAVGGLCDTKTLRQYYYKIYNISFLVVQFAARRYIKLIYWGIDRKFGFLFDGFKNKVYKVFLVHTHTHIYNNVAFFFALTYTLTL